MTFDRDFFFHLLKRVESEQRMEKEYFGIHYCGNDPHRYAESFAKLPKLDFLDPGWGGDVAHLRKLRARVLNSLLAPIPDYLFEMGRSAILPY